MDEQQMILNQLNALMEEKLILTLKDGRVIEGRLRAFDHLGNFLLAHAQEILPKEIAGDDLDERLDLTIISVNESLVAHVKLYQDDESPSDLVKRLQKSASLKEKERQTDEDEKAK